MLDHSPVSAPLGANAVFIGTPTLENGVRWSPWSNVFQVLACEDHYEKFKILIGVRADAAH